MRKPAIRDPEEASAVDWGLVGLRFGKILPMDIDGVLERNGHFLFLEWKKPNCDCSKGQSKTYEALNRELGDRSTVVVVRGDKLNGDVFSAMMLGRDKGFRPCDNDRLWSFVAEWLERVTHGGNGANIST